VTDRSKQLGENRISKLLLEFSVPAIIGMLVNALYNVVDRIFVGNGVGSLAIAGITVGYPLMLIIMAFGMLIGLGANSLVSINLGKGRKDEAEHIMGNALVLLILSSLAISVLGLLFVNPLLRVFGADNTVLPYARAYIQIILAGSVFQGLSFGMNNFIRGEGNPKIAMLTMLFGAVLNAILCPIFIFGLKMGIRGSALATIVAQGLSGLWVMYYFLSGQSLLKLRKKNLRLSKKIVLAILTIGVAPFALQMAASLVNLVLNRSLVYYGGDVAISGMGIVNSIMILVMMPIIGITQGAQPIIGFNYGAMKFDRVKKTLKLATLAATILACCGFVLVEGFPKIVVMLFNHNDQALISFTVYALRVYLAMLPIIGFQIVGANYFQAVGKPKQSIFLSLSRQLILLIPAVLIMPLFFKLHGVVLAGPVSDLGSSVLTGIFVWREMRNLDKKHENSHLAQLV
jgi:putative MATE family efflux protein